MTVAVNLHNITKIRAQADHYEGTNWVRMVFVGNSDGEFYAQVFFDDAELADDYAAAINSVNTVKPPAGSEAA